MATVKKTYHPAEDESIEWLFNTEIIHSEKLRATILTGILGLEALLLMIIYFFYRDQYLLLFTTHIAIHAILIFTLIIIIYELLVLYLIGRKTQFFLVHRDILNFFNGFAEITLLSILFVLIIEYSGQPAILQAPATLTYFVLIVLSTLRLNFKLSIFSGALAATEYVAISLYYSTHFRNIPADHFYPDLTGMQYLGQGVILLISGISAGFVADLIRKNIRVSRQNIKEKNDIIDLFGQQISPQIVNSILEKRDELSGVRKKVCVMFLDIRNFTPFVETHTPEEVVAYLNKLFHFMITIIQMYDGVINQFLGDGFMATFGAPVSKGNISQKAVLASKEIIKIVKQQNRAGSIPKTRIGIGLHYGEAVIGNIGSSLRKQYSITGNVVIMASRIEQLNKLFDSQLIISEEVFNELEAGAKGGFMRKETLEVKGINRPFSLYIFQENKTQKKEP